MKKTLIIYFLLFISIITLAQKEDHTLLIARACIDKSMTDSALELLKVPEYNKNSLVIQWIGDCYYQKNDFSKACYYYSIADSSIKNSASYALACCYAKLNNSSKAIFWLKNYLGQTHKKSELELLNEPAFETLAKTQEWNQLWKNDWYSEAEIEYHAIMALINKGKSSEALNELSTYERKLSKHEFYYLQAKAYEKEELLPPALASIEKAVSFYSYSDEYWALYARLLVKSKKYKDALENITKAIRLNPYHSVYYLERGRTARLAENYPQAQKDLKLYKELFPDSPEGYRQAGLLENDLGHHQNALENYDALLERDQTHAQYFILRGNIALSINQIEKADNDFSMALDLDPNLQEAYLKKGNTRFILTDISAACFYWTKARQLGSSEAAKHIYENCKEQ